MMPLTRLRVHEGLIDWIGVPWRSLCSWKLTREFDAELSSSREQIGDWLELGLEMTPLILPLEHLLHLS